jgi:hypothetical protein
MLIGEIFVEDFGVRRKNVWRVLSDGTTTHREIAALAASNEIKPRTRVETTEEDDHA